MYLPNYSTRVVICHVVRQKVKVVRYSKSEVRRTVRSRYDIITVLEYFSVIGSDDDR
jgi:hypothetical protein